MMIAAARVLVVERMMTNLTMAVEAAVKLLVADAAVAAFAEAAMLAYTINAVRAVRVLRLARPERMVKPEI